MIKRIFSIIISIAMTISMASVCVAHAASDPSSWAASEVNEAVTEGLVTDSVSRDYQAAITREQFCEMVVLAYEKISGNTARAGSYSFYDTDNNEVLKAANLGIVTGYGDGRFGPDDLITREQIAVMLVRMIDAAVSYANINVYNSNHFADSNSISDWARPAVNFAYDNKLMQGVGDNKIDPLANTTCEQAVLLAYRAFDNYYNEEAQLDSIYELTEEHIAQDDETFVHYTDNIVLAFIESGLSEEEKEDIADIVDGDVVAQLSGSINLLQIEVDVSTLDELNTMSEQLMENDLVNYVSPDILIDKSCIVGSTKYDNGTSTYTIDDEWWEEAIEVEFVWDNYSEYIHPSVIGVIDNGVFDAHEDMLGKVTFATDYYEGFNIRKNNENISENINHGTGVVSIIVANDNGIGITGIANKSNIVFASSNAWEYEWSNEIWDFEFESSLGFIYALKKEIEAGAKVINNSYGIPYYTETYFNNHPDEFEFTTYDNQKKYYELIAEILSIYTAQTMCELINNEEDVLVIQSAGNGENNSGPGVQASLGGFWRGMTEDNENIQRVCREYDISYDEIMEHVIIVGAVKNEKEGNNYKMTEFSNYGDAVNICAPGENIKVCNATATFIRNENESYNTWYNPISGTSIAAPMVTGTAAVLWGIEPTLTAAEVKDCIINGAKYNAIGVTGSDTGKEYPMLNVRGAVEQLLKKRNVYVTVIDSTGEGALSDVTINYGDGLTATTSIIGSCNIYLPVGYNKITLSKDGYKSQTVTIEDQYIGQTGDWIDGKIIELEKEEVQHTFNDHTYQFINKKMKWEDAKRYCEDQGGYLVTITSPEENEFVSQLSTNGEGFWIGATSDKNFTWVTGEQALFTDTLEYGEPSAAAKYIVSSSDGYWTNLIDREMCFVCEWGDTDEQKQSSEIADKIQGWWFYYNDEELMEHFSENICFNANGTYESTSWREKRTGTYTINGNTITANYDYYYSYGGSADYNYEWSGVEIFEFDGNTLRKISDTYNGHTNENITIFEHKDGYTDPYSV